MVVHMVVYRSKYALSVYVKTEQKSNAREQ